MYLFIFWWQGQSQNEVIFRQEAAGVVATRPLNSEGENVEDQNSMAEKSGVAVSQFLSNTSLCTLSGKHRCRNLFPAVWGPKRLI